MSALEDSRLSTAAQFDYPYSFPQSLEEELAGVLRAVGLFGRQARAVATRLGWGGGPGTTLAKAAAGEGYTRERVRQLEARVRGYAGRLPVPLPLTAAALRLVENAAPIARKRIPGELARAGLSAGPFDFTGLRSAAELGGLELRICERDGIVVRTGEAGLVSDLETTVQRLVKKNGAGTVEALSRRLVDETVPASTRRLLDVYADVTWLDERREWFFVRGAKSPVTNALRKMLSVSSTLTLEEVDEGLRRSFRPIALPREVLLRLCESTPLVAVSGDPPVVSATVSLDEARCLSALERAIVAIFRASGPVLGFSAAVALGSERGLNRNSVGLYLCRSPVLKTVSRGRYSLRGHGEGAKMQAR